MRKIALHISSAIPFVLLFISVLSGYNSSTEFYHKYYTEIDEFSGYGLIVSFGLVLHYIILTRIYCVYTKIAVVGLLINNIVNLVFVGEEIEKVYNLAYDFYVTLVVIVLCFILFIRKFR